MRKIFEPLGLVVAAITFTFFSVNAQNYSECQAPNAHMNPKCNDSTTSSQGASKPSKPGSKADATASTGEVLNIGGTYDVRGKSPDGTEYEGTVAITGDAASGYQFNWTIGSDTFQGKGSLSGNELTVIWGENETIVYKVGPGGQKMTGKWGAGGKGREKLRRQDH